jgi:hypothetical protein
VERKRRRAGLPAPYGRIEVWWFLSWERIKIKAASAAAGRSQLSLG